MLVLSLELHNDCENIQIKINSQTNEEWKL